MYPSRGEGGFVLSTRPPLSLCASNKLSSGSNEARNCKLSGEAQWRDTGLVFAGNVHGDESDTAESHARMGVMIPPLLWRVMFNPLCRCIHLQIFQSPLICINILHSMFNTDLSDYFPSCPRHHLSAALEPQLLIRRMDLNGLLVFKQQTFASRHCSVKYRVHWSNHSTNINTFHINFQIETFVLLLDKVLAITEFRKLTM